MGHDQRFKEILRLFIEPFLAHFFPELAAQLDFGELAFLDKELFEDPPEGGKREPDLVARAKTRGVSPEPILLHVEVQSERRSNVPARMFEYASLLIRDHRLPLLPLVIYLQGGRGLTEEAYEVRLFGREPWAFRFHCVGLGRMDAEVHARSDEALVAALSALMNRSKVRAPLEMRARVLRRIGRSHYDPYRKFLLTHLVETYHGLKKEEIESFRRLLTRPEFSEAKEMEVTWADKLKEEGRQEGRREGRSEGLLQGKQETLLRQLVKKFGDVPDNLAARVRDLRSVEQLDVYLERVLTAESLEELGL